MPPVDSDDLTRKQRREQARAQRKAAEQEAAASAVRRQRLTQLGVVVAIVVIAVVVILIATGGGSKKAPKVGSQAANAEAQTVATLINGIPQSANVLGNPSAPVTLQYFGDLECPICKDFTLGALPSIIERWVRPGKVRIEYRSMRTATHEPEVFKVQQTAALAAGKQNKMWYYVELFYHEQGEENTGYVTESYLQGLAQQVPGLNLAQWSSDRNNEAFANQLVSDEQAANSAGFTGTPSFLIGKTGGSLGKLEFESASNPAPFNAAIEKTLKS